EAGLARLRARTGTSTPTVVPPDARHAPWRHPAAPLFAAAAAAAALMLWFAIAPSASDEPPSAPALADRTPDATAPSLADRAPDATAPALADRVPDATAPSLADRAPDAASRLAPLADGLESGSDLDFDPELAIALGYGVAGDFVPGVANDDLPVISELDLLDFMAARDEGGRG
ncbi:MAG: hypothetical protein AAGC67_19260, partial [Myxococcota bacterium]